MFIVNYSKIQDFKVFTQLNLVKLAAKVSWWWPLVSNLNLREEQQSKWISSALQDHFSPVSAEPIKLTSHLKRIMANGPYLRTMVLSTIGGEGPTHRFDSPSIQPTLVSLTSNTTTTPLPPEPLSSLNRRGRGVEGWDWMGNGHNHLV